MFESAESMDNWTKVMTNIHIQSHKLKREAEERKLGEAVDKEVYAKIKSILELEDGASALDVLEAIILLKQKKPLLQANPELLSPDVRSYRPTHDHPERVADFDRVPEWENID